MIRESQGTLWNTNYYENKKCDFILKIVTIIISAWGNTFQEIPQMVSDICIQVREYVRESQGTFCQIFAKSNHIYVLYLLTMVTCCLKYSFVYYNSNPIIKGNHI